jgi:hypothetical protein
MKRDSITKKSSSLPQEKKKHAYISALPPTKYSRKVTKECRSFTTVKILLLDLGLLLFLLLQLLLLLLLPLHRKRNLKALSMIPCRKGCDFTLYQDAHIFDGSFPEVMLEDGVKFHHHRYREELCTTILEANHMVYIVGWSIYHQVKLLLGTSR